jgi:type II secretory ATPase GspE/PulE/Tfp pilus assembly ATPase PilB-like protein
MEPLNEQKLLEILLYEHYISQTDASSAQIHSDAHRGTAREFLINHNIITADLIGQAVAEYYSMPYADFNSRPATVEQVLTIPEEVAAKHRIVIFKEDVTTVSLATDTPEMPLPEDALSPIFGIKKITKLYALTEDIDAAFVYYRKPLATRFSEILKTKKPVAQELLTSIIEDALSFHASDIHFDTEKDRILVRFRVDGVLSPAGALTVDLYELLLHHLKVLAHMRNDEHPDSQDGAIHWISPSRVIDAIDMHLSVVPTVEGENVVIRILTSYVASLSLSGLGISAQGRQKLNAAIAKPFGMVLIVGLAGSGKTTTLYALMKILNRPDKNIMTIEDPVEYRITGVNQIQVNVPSNLTFTKGLKSIIRQDPDIVLVGEIRDRETAEIAVNAALIGQLLLSSFHADDAATAIPRLLDIGFEPYLLASTLKLVVAQRLVRKICTSCRVSHTLTAPELAALPKPVRLYWEKVNTPTYMGKGCTACSGSGFKGRTAMYEMIEMTPDLENLILTRPSAAAIWAIAKSHGAISLFDDGIEKVKNGITTLPELSRVAMPVSGA